MHEEPIQGKKNPKDLLTVPGFFNLILNFIKDMKNDSLNIMISHDTQALLENFKLSLQDFHKLNEEQLK